MGVSQIILRRSLPLLLAVLLVAASVVSYAVTRMTQTLDHSVAEHSRFLVNKALDHKRTMLERGVTALVALNEASADRQSRAETTVPDALFHRLDYDSPAVA